MRQTPCVFGPFSSCFPERCLHRRFEHGENISGRIFEPGDRRSHSPNLVHQRIQEERQELDMGQGFFAPLLPSKKCLAKPERYCQSHRGRRAHKSLRGTIRGPRTSVSASIAQGPLPRFPLLCHWSAASRIPKTWANINPRCIHSRASLHSAGCSNGHIRLARVKLDV